MPNPSNLYAEKIFSEQPLALWALDDQADYISLISEADRDMTIAGWTKSASAGTVTPTSVSSATSQFTNSYTTSFSTSTAAVLTLTSPSFTISSTTFAVGFYIYLNDQNISKIEIGFSGGNYVDVTPSLLNPSKWIYVSNLFVSTIGSKTANIKITYTGASTFKINGISIGTDAERFNSSSLGISKIAIPSTINTSLTYGVKSSAYGQKNNSAYYIVTDDLLVAKNSTVPLVYGAKNSTKILPNSSDPSLIFPGFGFMNESGKNKELTLEMWLRINSNSVSRKRIVGPINTVDGLYVDNGFLSLQIDKNIKSHYVGEWNRPMLIQIVMFSNNAMVLLNGDIVINMKYTTSELTTVNNNTKYHSSGEDQDWIGIYAYSDIPFIEVDCVAIYPYAVTEILAKRRFVYGQGVDYPDKLDSVYGGKSTTISYPFSNYSNNYSYPDFGKWSQGITDNLDTSNNYLSIPEYSLPDFIFNDQDASVRTLDLWLTDNLSLQGSSDYFMKMKPVSSWTDTRPYILFNSLGYIKEMPTTIYGIFKQATASSTEQTLLKIENVSTSEYFKITIASSGIAYKIKLNNQSEQTIKTDTVSNLSNKFAVGINIPSLSDSQLNTYSAFFSNMSMLRMVVGGDTDTSGVSDRTFSGNIYTVGFMTSRNFLKVSSLFTNGTFTATQTLSNASSNISTHYPSYGLILNKLASNAFLDIRANSYWEDYVPLSVLGKDIEKADGTKEFAIDYIQLNIDYPEINVFSSTNYDTSSATIRSYITFQNVTDGANKPASTFTTQSMSKTKAIVPTTGWETTKYEFINGAVAYVPTTDMTIAKNLAIVSHIDIDSNGIYTYPVKMKYLQLSSKALDEMSNLISSPETNPNNDISTKNGNKIYPYKIESGVMKFDSVNPIEIYKWSNPYLYLTKHSGIKISGDYNSSIDRGFFIPVTPGESAAGDHINGMQFSIMWNAKDFDGSTPIKVFSFQSIDFYLSSVNSTTLKLYAQNGSNAYNNLYYFVNGSLTSSPTLIDGEWAFISIIFPSLSKIQITSGSKFKVIAPVMINNFSYYMSNPNSELTQQIEYLWSSISSQTWDNYDTEKTWLQIGYSTISQELNIDMEYIYQIYTGTNKSIVDADLYSGKVKVHGEEYIYGKGFDTVLKTVTAV